jgi:hypothetical protein
MDEEQRGEAGSTEDPSTTELENTASQERSTYLDDQVADRTVGELHDGADRAAEQPDYGREGN